MTHYWALAALWLGLALVATLLSIWLRVATALSEIVVGMIAQLIIGAAIGGAMLGTQESWITFLSGAGAIILTFLAGAELDPKILRTEWKEASAVGVAGFVLPSSRVDVLLTMAPGTGGNEQATKIIMQNVKTLAAGQTIQQDQEGKPLAVPVITLLVTPEQAETLILATSQGRIQLALRNTLDTATVETRGTRQSALMAGLGGSRPAAPRRSTPVRTGPPVPAATTVEVYRGGVRSLERF